MTFSQAGSLISRLFLPQQLTLAIEFNLMSLETAQADCSGNDQTATRTYMGQEDSLGSLSRPHLVLIRGQVATTKGGFVGANIFGCITRYLLYPGLRRCPKPSPTNHLTNKQCLFYSSSRSSAVVVVHSRPSSVHPFPSLCIAALSGRDKP